MTDFLAQFNARLATYVAELEQMQTRNKREHAFSPTFWLEHADFTLARDVFVAAGGSIGHEVTKFSLVYTSNKAPSQKEASSICQAIDKPCEQLIAAAKVALFCGAGPSLANEIISDSLRLVKSVRDLGASIEAGELTKVPALTGRVWEYSVVARVSKSNCVATKRSMLQCITMLNSTIEELKEFLAEQEDTPAEPLDAVEREDAFDDFDFDSSLSAEERVLFESGLKLLTMASAILKRGVLTLKKFTASNDDEAFLKWTATLDLSYTAIQDQIVDFGAALYPPVGVDELSEAVEAIEKAGHAILTNLLAEPELTAKVTDELHKGLAAFDQQVATVKTQIDASR
uniref:Cyclin-D1-binding protein 1-like N-terminal domain-containing protein n=1 Tax=Globisporangium ultimum (strain ATCC 200006 / CBS 805.95 / DAOM BR144) TaxID=431595 RepID=K3WU84_GLOUD